MTLNVVLFYVIAGLTALSAIAMVISQNIVRAAAWLLFTLAGVAGIYFLLGAEFIGATQLLIYVGGTLVLVIFGVMLTAQGPFINLRPRAAEWVISLSVGLLLFSTLTITIVTAKPMNFPDGETASKPGEEMTDTTRLGLSLLGVEDADSRGPITGLDPEQRTRYIPQQANTQRKPISYLLPFELVSVHLVVVLIGAAYLARTKKRRERNPSE